jgi:putative membrane protein
MNAPFDVGLQVERTALAWRRTGLALLSGSLVAARILPEILGTWAAVLGLGGVATAGALLDAIHHRYRRHHDRLTSDGDRAPVAGGRLIAATAAFVLSAGLVTIVIAARLAASGGLDMFR